MYERLLQDRREQGVTPDKGRRGRKPAPQSAYEDAIKLRTVREVRGLTPKELGKKIGVQPTSILQMEKILTPFSKRKYGAKLIEALGDDVRQIVTLPDAGELVLGGTFRFSKEQALHLGKRAKELRQSLGLQIVSVAKAIGITPQTLRVWEKSLPLAISKDAQGKWEVALGVSQGWLTDATAPTPRENRSKLLATAMELADIKTASDEIKAIGSWLARKTAAQRTIDPSKLSDREKVWYEIFIQRYGVYGPECTLEECGTRFGMTRERARQILSKILERAQGLETRTPHIDLLHEMITEAAPITASEANQRFRQQLGGKLEVAQLDAFAREVLGKKLAIISMNAAALAVKTHPVLLPNSRYDPQLTKTIREVAFRSIRQCGAAQIHYVSGMVSEVTNGVVTTTDVLKHARVIAGFDWLSEQYGWFWFGEQKENRVLTLVKKMLAVAQERVDIDEIYDAVGRSRRWFEEDKTVYWIDPPHSVLVALLSKIDWLRKKQHDDFSLAAPIDPLEALSGVELMVYEVLNNHGNCAARATIKSELIDTGKASTMNIQFKLEGAPFIKRMHGSIYALRGRPISPESYQRAWERVAGPGGAHQAHEFAPDEEGNVSVQIEFTEYASRNSIVNVPSALRFSVPLTEYEVKGAGITTRLSRDTKGSMKLLGLAKYLRGAGFKAGDLISLTFAISERTVEVSSSAAPA